jgi:hypothetical protein
VSKSSLRIEYEGPFGKKVGEPAGADGKREKRRWGPRRYLVKGLAWGGIFVFLLVCPFVILIRLSTLLYLGYGVGGWLALSAGALATFVLLVLYLAVLRWRLSGTPRVPKIVRRGLLLLVAAYVCYGLLYVSGANVKRDDLRSHYSALHPLLRVASSTFLLLDRDAVITDLLRTHQDYQAMGLTANEASLHFEQEDGYVHALDLRTVGRPEWRNTAVAFYFWTMGFRTLRHVGTADHLHVSLPLPEE